MSADVKLAEAAVRAALRLTVKAILETASTFRADGGRGSGAAAGALVGVAEGIEENIDEMVSDVVPAAQAYVMGLLVDGPETVQ